MIEMSVTWNLYCDWHLNKKIYSKLSVYEAGNNILFAKVQTFAPDPNVN